MSLNARRRVAIFAPSFPPAYLGGGPARTLSALARDAPEGFAVHVLAPSLDADGSLIAVRPDCWTPVGDAKVFYASTHRPQGLFKAYQEIRRTKPDVIYLNSLFNLPFSILPQVLGRLKFWGPAQILLAPRGELDRGALNIRRRKKQLFISLMKTLRLHQQLTWHASAELEASAIRDVWGKNARILLRENETSLPWTAQSAKPMSRDLAAAFLGRISRKKGLLLALQALEGTTAQLTFRIYGPEEDAIYAQECKDAVSRLPKNVSVQFMGPVAPDEVRSVLADHEVLIMPTRGENFGHVIAESLSVSCMVMCSPATPWTDLLRQGGGIVVAEFEPEAWRSTIETLSSTAPQERLRMRFRAGQIYEKWRQEPKGEHVFTLLQNQ